ncbi:MAG: class I SAM-dependent methyltransferase [Rhodospirillales bacterium]|nr:class I SAM-dependent methyltransferase [Rhodospirillales bacterium]
MWHQNVESWFPQAYIGAIGRSSGVNRMLKNFSRPSAEKLINALVGIISSEMNSLSKFLEELKSPVTASRLSEIVSELAKNSRNFGMSAHSAKLFHDWNVPPAPEWHDHFIDQYLQLRQSHNTLWMERGVYSIAALKRGGDFLEICCGDGYNSCHFYSPFAKSIIALDFDPTAIAHAQKYNNANNVQFILADIRTDFPIGEYDNIIWDAAIEHFTEEEISKIMKSIKLSLKSGGILSGYTLVENDTGEKQLHQHEREFSSKQDLANFLSPYFRNVSVFETIHPTRHNLYYYASDFAVPFDSDWSGMLKVVSTQPAPGGDGCSVT